MCTQHMGCMLWGMEWWVDVANVTQVEHGTRPSTVLLTFANPLERDNFLALLCNGHPMRDGGMRHDTEKRCLIHGYDHDGFSPERLREYEHG